MSRQYHCETCIFWNEHKYRGPSGDIWGDCPQIVKDSGDRIEIWANNRDGEWIETFVETQNDFGCVLWQAK